MIPLLDLKPQYQSIKEEIQTAIDNVLDKGFFVLGENVTLLEKEIAQYCGAQYAVGVASGTDALLLSFKALGLGLDDEVITTPFTFIATVEAIRKTGARVVLADVDSRTFNIDPADIAKKITSKTKAIVPVHMYGQMCLMDPILDLAQKHSLKIIEDCAQSIGAVYKNRKAGSIGDLGCFSFFPSKNLGAYGDGGMITTNNETLAQILKVLRQHGAAKKCYHELDGYNSRLDEIQAAVLRVKLKYIDRWNRKRNQNADLYNQCLHDIGQISIPFKAQDCSHVYYLYTILVPKRDQLQEHLKSNDIASVAYYPRPLHFQPVYKDLGYKKGSLPQSESICKKVLSLPMYPELSKEDIKKVCQTIKDFF